MKNLSKKQRLAGERKDIAINRISKIAKATGNKGFMDADKKKSIAEKPLSKVSPKKGSKDSNQSPLPAKKRSKVRVTPRKG